MHGHPCQHRLHLGQQIRNCIGFNFVALVENHHRLRTAIKGQHQLAFNASKVYFARSRLHHQHGVDIAGNCMRLGAHRIRRCATRECRASRQHMLHSFKVFRDQHPVTYCNICTNVAHSFAVCCREQNGAPTSINSPHTSNTTRRNKLRNILRSCQHVLVQSHIPTKCHDASNSIDFEKFMCRFGHFTSDASEIKPLLHLGLR